MTFSLGAGRGSSSHLRAGSRRSASGGQRTDRDGLTGIGTGTAIERAPGAGRRERRVRLSPRSEVPGHRSRIRGRERRAGRGRGAENRGEGGTKKALRAIGYAQLNQGEMEAGESGASRPSGELDLVVDLGPARDLLDLAAFTLAPEDQSRLPGGRPHRGGPEPVSPEAHPARSATAVKDASAYLTHIRRHRQNRVQPRSRPEALLRQHHGPRTRPYATPRDRRSRKASASGAQPTASTASFGGASRDFETCSSRALRCGPRSRSARCSETTSHPRAPRRGHAEQHARSPPPRVERASALATHLFRVARPPRPV